MKVAYADPPYIGQAKRLYGKHKDYQGEVDHKDLIDRLCDEFPDGWALSLSCQALQYILGLCPDDVRVLSWTKRYHGFLAGIRLQYCWEPVILKGGREGPHIKGDPTLRDWVDASPEGFTFRKMPQNHVRGKKPQKFCFWLFDCLGLQPGDTLVDLYPGTGAVGRAWERYQQDYGMVRCGQRLMFSNESWKGV